MKVEHQRPQSIGKKTMPTKRARKRARTTRRRSPAQSPQARESGLAVTIVRLAIGAAGLGSAHVVQGTRARSPAGNGQARRQPGPFGVGDLVAGLAVVSAEMVDRLASRAGRLGPVP